MNPPGRPPPSTALISFKVIKFPTTISELSWVSYSAIPGIGTAHLASKHLADKQNWIWKQRGLFMYNTRATYVGIFEYKGDRASQV